ncbi:MAG: glycosyltransferase family 4 protein [Anaerolineae bacterium]|nr:glycosyltransferase family 4 protein [Anaerolineae bacterium]
MNIVHLAPFAFSPKATVSARILPMATALARRGHTVTVLIPPYDNPADGGKRWQREGVRLENVWSAGQSRPGFGLYAQLARRLAERARELKPDVVHVFKPVGVAALAMWLLNRRPAADNGRLILDNDDWEGRGGWLDVNAYPLAQKLFMQWQERWALGAASCVTCASPVLVERTRRFRTTRRQPADDVFLLPNGPDEALRAQVARAQVKREALRAAFGWRQPIAIYAGTIPRNHDLDIAVHALRRAPDVRWVIVATGDGIPSLRRAIAAAGIAERVEWHGFMSHAQLIERLVAADIALYPYRDTNINRAKCSGKVMDYMVCGKAMIVSDVGMNRVYLEHERSGLLTPPGDVEAFYAALKRLLDDPAFADRIGRAAQERIWARFGWAERIGELERIYQMQT